jgi:ABC-2 type transport system permease protein
MLSELWVLTLRELKKWLKTPFPALGLFVGPIVWVFIFGTALNSAFFSSGTSVATLEGAPDYFNFMATGMAVSMGLTYASRAGGSLFTDRFTGYLETLLVSPAARSTIVVSKVLAGVVLSLIQAFVLLAMSVPIGLNLSYIDALSFVLIVALFLLLSFGFGAIFLIISLRTKRWQSQQLVAPLVVTPLTFLSSVFYPVTKLPQILQALSLLNPLSYAADALRELFFQHSPWLSAAFQFNMLALVGFTAAASGVLAVTHRMWL